MDESAGHRGNPETGPDETSYPSFHCWLLPPLQVHNSTRAPSAVDPPVTSRQSPDWTPVIVPLELTVHCWLVPPLQAQMIALVPAVVPLPLASRHIVVPPTLTVSSLALVWVQVWLAPPLQVWICCWVPPVAVEFGSSRHLPAPTACSGPVAEPTLLVP